jgi:hypothetical protein
MSKQPEALRLADDLDQWSHTTLDVHEAAAELRRLHEVNAELLEALKDMGARYGLTEEAVYTVAKAEGDQA